MDGEAICVFSGSVLFPNTVADLYGKGERGIAMDLIGEPSLEEVEIGTLLNEESGGSEYCLNWSNRTFRKYEQFEEIKDSDNHRERKYVLKDRTRSNLSEIRSIVSDLLFNKIERNKINLRHKEARERQGKNMYRRYLKERKKKGRAPTKHTITAIIANWLTDAVNLKLMDYDSKIIEFFQNFILNLWFAIKRTPYYINNESKFHIREHAIGMLFMLTKPFVNSEDSEDPDVLLNANEFLKEHLPHQNELKEWNAGNFKTKHKYAKHDVTAGINNFKYAVSSAKANREAVLQSIRVASRKRVYLF